MAPSLTTYSNIYSFCSALNEQEHYRGYPVASSSNMDDRTFHEDQLWPFAESVKAGVGSVMCAYNRVNGTYSCENRRLVNDILKEELDFQVRAKSRLLTAHGTDRIE